MLKIDPLLFTSVMSECDLKFLSSGTQFSFFVVVGSNCLESQLYARVHVYCKKSDNLLECVIFSLHPISEHRGTQSAIITWKSRAHLNRETIGFQFISWYTPLAVAKENLFSYNLVI